MASATATISATATAAITARTISTAEATSAAATFTGWALTSDVNDDRAALHIGPVQHVYCCLCLFVCRHLDESESTLPSGSRIQNDSRRCNRTCLLENPQEISILERERQITDIQLLIRHFIPPRHELF
jgi:hypothetical protein